MDTAPRRQLAVSHFLQRPSWRGHHFDFFMPSEPALMRGVRVTRRVLLAPTGAPAFEERTEAFDRQWTRLMPEGVSQQTSSGEVSCPIIPITTRLRDSANALLNASGWLLLRLMRTLRLNIGGWPNSTSNWPNAMNTLLRTEQDTLNRPTSGRSGTCLTKDTPARRS